MANRRKLTQQERMDVYRKMGGHCAYCGCVLEYNDMQVDHVKPLNGWSEKGPDTLDNMLPACRSCNHYKSAMSVESFRKMVENITDCPCAGQRYLSKCRSVWAGFTEPTSCNILFREATESNPH